MNSEQVKQLVPELIASPPQSGVYFLFREGQLRYIGQSVNVHIRANLRQRKADEAYFYLCPIHELDYWESKFIYQFQPPDNGRWGNRHGPYAGICAPLPEEFLKQGIEMSILHSKALRKIR